MTATLTRTPGWDAKVRKAVRLHYGSMRTAAEHLSIDVDDIGYERSHGMRIWSRMVRNYGSTEALLDALDIDEGTPMPSATLTSRGITEVAPDAMGTVRVVWPDGTITEVRRAPDKPDVVRLRIRGEDIDAATIIEHYGRRSGAGQNLITGLTLHRE